MRNRGSSTVMGLSAAFLVGRMVLPVPPGLAGAPAVAMTAWLVGVGILSRLWSGLERRMDDPLTEGDAAFGAGALGLAGDDRYADLFADDGGTGTRGGSSRDTGGSRRFDGTRGVDESRQADGSRRVEDRVDTLEQDLERLSSSVDAVYRENRAISEAVDDLMGGVRRLREALEATTRGEHDMTGDDTDFDELKDAYQSGGGGRSPGVDAGGTDAGGTDTDAHAGGTDATATAGAGTGTGFDAGGAAVADPEGVAIADAEELARRAAEERERSAERRARFPANTDADVAADSSADSEGAPGAGGAAGAQSDPATDSERLGGDRADRPYLRDLPGGYVADLLVMEWLEFLVEEGSVTDAARAIDYYERVGWVSDGVADDLVDHLTGFGDVDRNRVDDPGCDDLAPEHHTRSLKYVVQLAGSTTESLVVERWGSLAGTQGS